MIFDLREGYFRETENNQVMEKVDAESNIPGFFVLKVSSLLSGFIEEGLK